MKNEKGIKKQNNFYSKSLLITVSTLFVVSIILTLICSSYFFSNDRKDNITYKEESDIKYQVCLKNNGFFQEKCLDSSKSYVSQLIDYITIDFSDIISSNKKLNENYTYRLTSRVVATSKEDSSKILYDKTAVLDEKDYKNTETNNKANTTVIQKVIKINYNDYNSIINEFKKDYVLSLDAKLVLTMDIKYNGNYSDKFDTISSSKKLVMEIPLSEQTVSINTNKANDNSYKVIYDNSINIYEIIVFAALLILVLASGIVLIISVIKMLPYKQEYIKKLEKILKEYDRAIVTVTKKPDTTKKSINNVPSFEELLDARENLEKPILFYQNRSGSKSTFIIINDKEAYVYTLSLDYSERD